MRVPRSIPPREPELLFRTVLPDLWNASDVRPPLACEDAVYLSLGHVEEPHRTIEWAFRGNERVIPVLLLLDAHTGEERNRVALEHEGFLFTGDPVPGQAGTVLLPVWDSNERFRVIRIDAHGSILEDLELGWREAPGPPRTIMPRLFVSKNRLLLTWNRAGTGGSLVEGPMTGPSGRTLARNADGSRRWDLDEVCHGVAGDLGFFESHTHRVGRSLVARRIDDAAEVWSRSLDGFWVVSVTPDGILLREDWMIRMDREPEVTPDSLRWNDLASGEERLRLDSGGSIGLVHAAPHAICFTSSGPGGRFLERFTASGELLAREPLDEGSAVVGADHTHLLLWKFKRNRLACVPLTSSGVVWEIGLPQEEGDDPYERHVRSFMASEGRIYVRDRSVLTALG